MAELKSLSQPKELQCLTNKELHLLKGDSVISQPLPPMQSLWWQHHFLFQTHSEFHPPKQELWKQARTDGGEKAAHTRVSAYKNENIRYHKKMEESTMLDMKLCRLTWTAVLWLRCLSGWLRSELSIMKAASASWLQQGLGQQWPPTRAERPGCDLHRTITSTQPGLLAHLTGPNPPHAHVV